MLPIACSVSRAPASDSVSSAGPAPADFQNNIRFVEIATRATHMTDFTCQELSELLVRAYCTNTLVYLPAGCEFDSSLLVPN